MGNTQRWEIASNQPLKGKSKVKSHSINQKAYKSILISYCLGARSLADETSAGLFILEWGHRYFRAAAPIIYNVR